MRHIVILGSPQNLQGSSFKIKTKTEKAVCFHLSPVRREMWDSLLCNAVVIESINSFKMDFYKSIEVSSRGGLETYRFGKPPDY